jgi:phosphoenolpyruvate---glycerone phosphotransferase subunit DhaL
VITTAIVQAQTVSIWLADAEEQISAQSDYLTQLDAAIGDGDHGTNMRRGFEAVGKALAGQGNGTPPGQLLILAGKTLVATVGGASGPLWGSALRRAGRALGSSESFDGQQLAEALDAAIEAIIELGAAAPGDKTMIDALTPASQALQDGLAAGHSLEEAVAAAAQAAQRGAESTVPMQARKGRASYLGERSIGHQDPGATSAAILMAALAHAVASVPG